MGLGERLWERLTSLREQHSAPPLTAGSVAAVTQPTEGPHSEDEEDPAPQPGPDRSNGRRDGLTAGPPSEASTSVELARPNGLAAPALPGASARADAAVPSTRIAQDPAVPRGLQVAASWSWRVILVVALIYGLAWVFGYLSEVTIPVAIAILLAAMLSPVANRLRTWGVPRGGATAITVLGGLGLIVAALYLIISQIVSQAATLSSNVSSSFNTLVQYLQNGPLHISAEYFRVDTWTERLQTWLSESSSSIATYAAEFGTQVGHFVAGFAITLFSLFYFLYDGRGIFSFLVKFFPRHVQGRVDDAAWKGWRSLSHYVRATVLVALSDAIGVLIGAWALGVPAYPALAALVFIGAFVPLVGAFVSGFVAVAVALVALGWVQALIMFGIIILVMQVEGHLLQPFLLGHAVKLHPLAVLLAIAIGIIVGGIVGALIAVPILAFTKSFVQHLTGAPQPPVRRLRWPATGSHKLV